MAERCALPLCLLLQLLPPLRLPDLLISISPCFSSSNGFLELPLTILRRILQRFLLELISNSRPIPDSREAYSSVFSEHPGSFPLRGSILADRRSHRTIPAVQAKPNSFILESFTEKRTQNMFDMKSILNENFSELSSNEISWPRT